MTQAVLYPSKSSSVSSFLSFAEEKRLSSRAPPVDLLMDDYVRKNDDGNGHTAEGDYFWHVGYYSSVDAKEHHEPKEFVI